ncbi:MFS general substrate transporter [Athelia psychrophila]|uniref:MFS general substrate transporter n=1 Tax=Athelia psychrophila TaxID=1759441 RepID=A0A166LT81_9AGAM|nr:MFS general substrate transporter [Fibularhizoctonia sp. CBS 109695]
MASVNNNAEGELDEKRPASTTTLASPEPAAPKDARFWMIFVSLLVATFLSALDMTAISTALPTIAAALHSEDFAWIGNAYSITSTAFIPWAGGAANIFGRRPVLLTGLLFFLVGSAMCGASTAMPLMLAGRAFQGVGSGVILTLVEIVLADLVPLAERGAFQGAFGAVWALASATGPVIGGALAASNWHWLFYMNLPLTALVIAIVGAFLDLRTPEEPGGWRAKVRRMDWLGNLVFIPSITLLILALVWGGQSYAWADAHVLAPLLLGALGLAAWFVLEKHVVAHPTVPFALLANRTTLVGFATTWLHGISALSVFFYWPAYFQAAKGASAVRSAIDFFSVAFVVAPCAMLAGGTISATQVYKPQNIIAWVLMTVGPGLLSLVHADSSKAMWVALPIPFAAGMGLLYAATVFPVLAPLPPALAGQALAFLIFVRNFGNVLGITVGSTALTNSLAKKLPATFIAQLPGGVASAYSAIPAIAALPEPLRQEVRVAFAESIRVIWLVLIPFGGVGLLCALGMRAMALETVTDEAWGMAHRETDKAAAEDGAAAAVDQ